MSSFARSYLTIGFLTRETRRKPLLEQELIVIAGHRTLVRFCGFRVAQSLIFCVV
jgi:hypothetical protein